MSIFYSKSAGGFFDSIINAGKIPSDAVSVSDDAYVSLMAAQSSGKVIQGDANGNPVAVNPPSPSAAQLAVKAALEAQQAGINITSTVAPSLSGTYAITSDSQANVSAIVTYILLNGNFPGASDTMPWSDKNGNVHVFPTVAVFKNFATAFADYVSAVALYGQSGGQIGSLPSNDIAIP